MPTAINGFRKTGIWPHDLDVLSDADFLPSATTDIQLENNECSAEKPTDGQNHDLITNSLGSTENRTRRQKTKVTPIMNHNLDVHGSKILRTFVQILRKSQLFGHHLKL
ncbi:hypothetical protein J437_LFUL012227 [Ladona fulva]|uniref:Uncharacterized protein n=1 Tax=Ladona fulva TaxID=123851 RepID=A0A8K0KF26_LADFU|nr:hypothetical protein J437_LFUL012227 [Ladona fulva]